MYYIQYYVVLCAYDIQISQISLVQINNDNSNNK